MSSGNVFLVLQIVQNIEYNQLIFTCCSVYKINVSLAFHFIFNFQFPLKIENFAFLAIFPETVFISSLYSDDEIFLGRVSLFRGCAGILMEESVHGRHKECI